MKHLIQRAQPQPGGRRLLHAADARAPLPGDHPRGGPEQVPLRDGQHPRPMLLGPHRQPEPATAKAKDLVRWPWPRPGCSSPWKAGRWRLTRRGLVIGGGLAGMTAALALADQGFRVHLVEKADLWAGTCTIFIAPSNGAEIAGVLGRADRAGRDTSARSSCISSRGRRGSTATSANSSRRSAKDGRPAKSPAAHHRGHRRAEAKTSRVSGYGQSDARRDPGRIGEQLHDSDVPARGPDTWS